MLNHQANGKWAEPAGVRLTSSPVWKEAAWPGPGDM